MVSLLASVRDKKGHLVNTLTKDDFAVEQDSHPQTITYFSKNTDLPLTLGLLVDTSMSQRRLLDQERAASHDFLDEVLREGTDKAFVIHFDYQVELLQDVTTSRKKLDASLEELGTPEFSNTNGNGGSGGSGNGGSGNEGSGGGRGPRGHGGGGTLLYDSIYLASNEVMKKQQGRKAIIVLTDGVDRGSKESLRDAIETAQRADTLVYSILFADKEGYGNRGGGTAAGTEEAAAAGWVEEEWVGAGWAAAAIVSRKKTAPTAKKFSSNSPKKPAAAFSKSPRSSPSTRFTPRSMRSCAISTE